MNLGTFPNRPESGEFADAYPMGSPVTAKAEARILADIKAADTADLTHSILGMVDLMGPTDARGVRLLAAECVREMQRSRGLSLDMAGQLRWFMRFRDLVAEIFLPKQAAMIRASLTTSEMQGLDLDAPKSKPIRKRMEDECPDCGTVMDKEWSDDGAICKCQCGTETNRDTHPTPDEAYERARDRESTST